MDKEDEKGEKMERRKSGEGKWWIGGVGEGERKKEEVKGVSK